MSTLHTVSFGSLRLEPLHNGEVMSTATGFLVKHEKTLFLVTNRHVFTGRHQETGQVLDKDGAFPQEIRVHCLTARGAVETSLVERLYSSDTLDPLWLEHPDLLELVDVVALPLSSEHDLGPLTIYPYDPWRYSRDIYLHVAGDVSIVGFPFGRSGGAGLAIWSRGSVASEPSVYLDGLPRFFVDSRTRPGQSGSPVVIYRHETVVRSPTGGIKFVQDATEFVGVYSGRVNEQSDLGYVWHSSTVADIVSRGTRPAFDSVHNSP